MAARGATQPADRMRRILHYLLLAKRVSKATAILSSTTTRYRAAVSNRDPRAASREVLNINMYKSIVTLSKLWQPGNNDKFLTFLYTKLMSRWGGRDFPHPSRPASYTTRTQPIPGVKWPGRGVDHPPPYSTEVKERVELYIYSTSGSSWPVIG